MSALAWVVGRGGLLGSHVAAELGGQRDLALWAPAAGALRWADGAAAEAELGRQAAAFLHAATERAAPSWSVFWCAGAGVIGTSPAALERESALWEGFLATLGNALEAEPRAARIPGRLFFASSAGGVWGGSAAETLTEREPCRPLSAYGSAKVRQERALETWAASKPLVSTLVARISNLYGPGQKLDKPQGLISHMTRCLIHGRPVHIYVPLDTIRDYVFVEDAAREIVRGVRRLDAEVARAGTASRVVKICAAEEETTISTLIGVFRRMCKKQVKVISGLHAVQSQQPPRLHFRSVVWTDQPRARTTSLLVGIRRVYQDQLARFQAGALPPPPAFRPR